MTKNIAKLVMDLNDFTGHAALYELSTPYLYEDWDGKNHSYKYVVVSKTTVPFSGPETYIFPANKKGEVTNWSELPGSRRGSYSHADVLRDAGYEVVL